MISSPCIGVCEIDPKLQRCKGCWRTTEHIEKWSIYSELERIQIMEELEISDWEIGRKDWNTL